MKKAVAFAKVTGLVVPNIVPMVVPMVVPIILGLFGMGCVNLDKPSAVADCASGKTGPCFDGDKKDAAVANPDVAGSDSLPGADRPGDSADVSRADDTDVVPDAASEDKPDAGPATSPDAAPDTATTSVDGLQADTRPAAHDTAGSPDLAGPELPPMPIDSQPGLADLADGRVPDASDAGPDSGPDLGLDTPPDLPPVDGPPATTTTITFKAGRATATGVNGFGWVTLGSADAVTSPVCGATSTPITAATPCTADSVWDNQTSLCVTGTVPALATDPDYEGNWGVEVGTNLKEPVAAGGLSFESVAVNITGTPSSGLRIELHRSGEAVGKKYCALFTSGTPVPLSKFNTQCWNDLGDAFPDADGAKIDKISVQVPSGSTEIPVDKLCLISVVLGS